MISHSLVFFLFIEQTFTDILHATCIKKDIGLNKHGYDERTSGREKKEEEGDHTGGKIYTEICAK